MGRLDLRFDTIESGRDMRALEAFLHSHPGTYSNEIYERWLADVCLPGIAQDERRALGWFRHGKMIGDAVFKPTGVNTIEVKNFRVEAGELHGRGLAGFMLRQITPEAANLLDERGMLSAAQNELVLQLDTTAGSPAESFFLKQGFHEVGRAALYEPGRDEVLMQMAVPLN